MANDSSGWPKVPAIWASGPRTEVNLWVQPTKREFTAVKHRKRGVVSPAFVKTRLALVEGLARWTLAELEGRATGGGTPLPTVLARTPRAKASIDRERGLVRLKIPQGELLLPLAAPGYRWNGRWIQTGELVTSVDGEPRVPRRASEFLARMTLRAGR